MFRTNDYLLSYVESLYASRDNDRIFLQDFKAGHYLTKQDDKLSKVFIIKEGVVKCFFREDNDKDYIVEFLSSGEIIGEIEAIRSTACLCSVQALTPVTTYALTVPFFHHLLEKDLHLNKLLLYELSERIINTSSRAAFQQLFTLEHGVSKLLELQAKQRIEIVKEDMAAYLGVSIRSLNRILLKLNGKGKK